MNLKTVTIADLKDHPNNPNTHPDKQIDALVESLDRFDQVKNIVIWQGYILAGHALRASALKKGLPTLEAVDVSHWSEGEATAFMLADIRLPDMAFIDDEVMAEALRAIDEPLDIPGFDEDFLEGLEAVEVDDPYDEWGGMPEFHNTPEACRTLIVHFETIAAVDLFVEMIEQEITEKTKTIWYPPKKKTDRMIFENE